MTATPASAATCRIVTRAASTCRVYRFCVPLHSMRTTVAAHGSFACFGLFWGTWGAALPALRASAGLDGAALGTTLLFVGLGPLPSMLLIGRVGDRLRGGRAPAAFIALGLCG